MIVTSVSRRLWAEASYWLGVAMLIEADLGGYAYGNERTQ